MPFAEEFYPGYKDFIEPAVTKAGLECIRADKEPQGYIQKQMFARIFDSPIMIADISGANPNVFYELGVSHCVGAKTIMVSREDFIDRIPFDIAPYRVLVYPKPPKKQSSEKDKRYYLAKVEETVQELIIELEKAVNEDTVEISNPVQDYLASRSPLTCVESLYLDRFGGALEEELLRRVENELMVVSLTGSHFVNFLTGYIETGERKTPIKVDIQLLDPADQKGWEYVYHLREGHPVSKAEFEKFIEQDRNTQQRVVDTIKRLNNALNFSVQISYYSGIPLFWAYYIDIYRLILGYLAKHRIGGLNLPVTVLVENDPKTQILYSYFVSTIESLTKN
jgi:hypothetical protein